MSSWTMKSSYTYGCRIRCKSLVDAVEAVKSAFQSQGFGLPPGTTDLQFEKIFAGKGIDAEFRPTRVLGFCHPKTAHSVLLQEPAAAVLLPCNVVVGQCDKEGVFEVSSIAPAIMLDMMDNKSALMQDTVLSVDVKIKNSLLALRKDSDLDKYAWPTVEKDSSKAKSTQSKSDK